MRGTRASGSFRGSSVISAPTAADNPEVGSPSVGVGFARYPLAHFQTGAYACCSRDHQTVAELLQGLPKPSAKSSVWSRMAPL